MSQGKTTESIFTIEADQWSEHGFIYRNGLVIAYETDRKEQTYMEFGSQPAAEFIADENNPQEIRDWADSYLDRSAE